MLSRHCPWRYRDASWSDATEIALQKVFAKIADHFTKGHDLNDEACDDPEVAEIATELDRLEKDVEILRIIHGYGDWSSTVYLLSWILRAVITHPQFTQLLYFWGLGSSGKDLLMVLITKMLGDAPGIGYAASVAGSYVTSVSGRGSEDSTPFMSSWRNLKFLVFSEVPARNVNFDVLKQLTEQQGVSMSARNNSGDAANWTPTLTIMLTSNHACQPADIGDTGVPRRLAMLRTKSVYKAEPDVTNPYEKQIDPTVSSRADAGKFSADLFHLVKHLLPVLSSSKGTEIKPEPTEVTQESQEMFKKVSSSAMKAWLIAKTVPVARREAATFEDLKTASASFLSVEPRVAALMLESEGVKTADAGGGCVPRRRAVWMHPKAAELGILTTTAPGIRLRKPEDGI